MGVTLLMHDSDEDRLSTMSLARIGEEMDFGDMVGAFAITSADDVPPHALQAELTALGNDGTFFDDRMEPADDCRIVHDESMHSRRSAVRVARDPHAGMRRGRAAVRGSPPSYPLACAWNPCFRGTPLPPCKC